MPLMTTSPATLLALDASGHRVTGPRRTLADLIAERRGPFSAADLAADAAGRNVEVGRATIFRFLDLLADLGAVERIDLPDGGHAYVACEPVHHHHVVCSACGRMTEIADGVLRDAVGDIEAVTGFRIDSHRLELFGLCPVCRTREEA
jgi:Fur family transcriptional regulator, ferric uptake regulator